MVTCSLSASAADKGNFLPGDVASRLRADYRGIWRLEIAFSGLIKDMLNIYQ